MKKIIEFFNNLFGKKWEYVPTEYASPIEQLVASKRSAVQDEPVEAKKTAKKEKKPAAKKAVKKVANKTAKKKIK